MEISQITKKSVLGFLALIFCLIWSSSAFAVGINDQYRPKNIPVLPGSETAGGATDYSITGIQLFIGNIITIVIMLAGTLAIYYIVTNGWWLIASAGKQETIESRKKGLTWAIVGLIFVIVSYILIRFIIELPSQAFDEGEPNKSGIENADGGLKDPEPTDDGN